MIERASIAARPAPASAGSPGPAATALQNVTTSGLLVLLPTGMDAGQGIGALVSQHVGNTAFMLTFFAQELGLPAK